MPCGTVNSPRLKFTLDDKRGKSLLTPERVPRFYSIEGNVKKYVDYQWTIEPFPSDSSQKYMLAKTITAIENITKTFFFDDSVGVSCKIEVVIGNDLTDPVCPGAFFPKKVTFNNQTQQDTIKDHVPHYQFRLL